MTSKDAWLIAWHSMAPWSKWGSIADAEADGHSSRINGHGSQCVPRAWRWFPALHAAWVRGWNDEDAAMAQITAQQELEQ